MSNTAKQPEMQICCCVIRAREKDKIYDAGENGELKVLTEGMPVIPTTAQSHEVKEDGKDVYRTIQGKSEKIKGITAERAKQKIAEKGIKTQEKGHEESEK